MPAVVGLCLAAAPCASEEDETGKDVRTVLFGSLEVGRSVFVTSGRKRTLLGTLDESGPAFLLTAGAGRKRERDSLLGSMEVRQAAEASALLGYQWVWNGTVAAAFVGPELDVETASDMTFRHPDDRAKVGARFHGEVWSHPREDILLNATFIAGSAREHVWSRAAAGWKAWDRIFVGPEVSGYRTSDYYEARFGVHATGIEIGRFTLRLSGGWRVDEERDRSGPYVGLSTHWRPKP